MRVRLRLPHQPSVTVDFNPNEATFGDLVKEVTKATDLPEDAFTVKCGFPPREVLAAVTTPITDILSDRETVTVHCTQPPPNLTASGSSKTSTPTASRSPKKRQSASLSSATLYGGLPNVRSLHTPAKRAAPQSALGQASPHSPSPAKRRRGLDLGASEEDWSVNLVDIFSKSGADLTKAQKALRGAFKNAVQRREASNMAERRWTAASTDSATFEELEGHKFRVTFPVGTRKNETETYLALPKPFISVVLREVYSSGADSRINLRPHYMAEGQPLVFWNVVHHFGGTNFSAGLKELMPFVTDWSFYTEDRDRILSEKAMANIRQREETKARRLERMKTRLVTLGQYVEGTRLEYDEADYSDSLYSATSDGADSADSGDDDDRDGKRKSEGKQTKRV